MATPHKDYNFNSVVLYDQAFDPREDIIVSFVRTNEESTNLGALTLEGGEADSSLLDLESPTQGDLNLNFSNVFDNLCIFLYDSRVPVLTGTSRSHCVSSFDIQGISGITWLSAGETFYLAPSGLSKAYPSITPKPGFPDDYYIDGTGSKFIFPANVTQDDLWGWYFTSTPDTPASQTQPTLLSVASATSGIEPWEISDWYATVGSSGATGPGHNASYLSAFQPGTLVNPVLSGFKSFGEQGKGIERIPIEVTDPRNLLSPGCNLVNSNFRGVSADTGIQNPFQGFSLSGLMAMAVIDNNGAFGLSGSQRFFYSGGTEGLSAGNFAVRTLTNTSGLSTISNPILNAVFDYKGSVTPTPYHVVDTDWKLQRIGFKRHLQDLVLYKREDGIYENDHVFSTGFKLSALPPSVKIGLSYSGKMPMEIQNLTVNGTIVE